MGPIQRPSESPLLSESVPLGVRARRRSDGELGPGQLEDDVVAPPVGGDVLPGVVDDLVGAERADQVQVPGAAHPGHLGPEPLGELHGEGADAARGADDQDLLARLDARVVAQALQGGQRGQGDGRGLLEAQVGRLALDHVLGDADVLGEAARGDVGVHLVAGAQPGHGLADRLDLPGDVAAEQRLARPAQPELRADDVGQAPHEVPVPRVGGGGVDADEHLVVLDDRVGDLLQGQDLGGAVPVVGDRLHDGLLPRALCGTRVYAVHLHWGVA